MWALLTAGLGGARRSDSAGDDYAARQYLLSRAERSFYGVLVEAVDPAFVIFTKVRLADLLLVRKGAGERMAKLNRIASKHVDFVICDRERLRPRLVIELDDASHAREDRRCRDDFVDQALRGAGLRILRVRAARGYKIGYLREQIEKASG